MSHRIFKFPLLLEHRELVQIPKDGKILSVALQEEMPVLFVQVPEHHKGFDTRIIRVVSTGEVFNGENCDFIGTIQAGKPTWFVAHVYEQRLGGGADVVSLRYEKDFKDIQAEIRPRVEELVA